jgi:pimeloyl-ACP methyl ester carboxylesterase
VTNEIRYARHGGVAIAYQVVGSSEVDLVYVADYVSNLVYGWEYPYWRDFYERLARSFRLILFDKRGTGLSDHGAHFAALETRMEDLRVVLDAAGSSSSVILGSHEGCAMATLYAATYPERTRALVLFHPRTKGEGTDDRAAQEELSELHERWGTQAYSDELLKWGSPTLYEDEEYRRFNANWLRVGASPSVAYALNRAYAETDLTEVLPAVRVPTLVLYRRGRFDEEQKALDVAARITAARAMRVSGEEARPGPTRRDSRWRMRAARRQTSRNRHQHRRARRGRGPTRGGPRHRYRSGPRRRRRNRAQRARRARSQGRSGHVEAYALSAQSAS